MTTFTTAPVAPLLERLFGLDARSIPSKMPGVSDYWNTLSEADKERILHSRTDYHDFYARMKDVPLAVSPETGRLLYMLARSIRASSVVEFGTSFGLSTICLASALRDNGGGRLITSEFEPAKVERARANLAEAGVADLVEIREGDALETLAANLSESIDLVLLDGAKGLYLDVLDLLQPRLRPGALVLADNADCCPPYVERVRDAANGWVSVPFADDVEMSMWIC
ncbi:O-methyltransferase [Novosphingobium sp. HII-3]|uniref:O-methyltransferase n=1 Tax=Novosphingobium sp. HII-3 TaxID=2075565 RepID=UPI000CDB9E27|nr:O-methyltransferase [Novosphingobium sp. HII-3]